MKNICLCFQVHHPFHIQAFRFTDIDSTKSYYDDLRIEREIINAVTNYYLPSNDFLLRLINKYKGKLNVAFYISGTASDQFLMYEPTIINSFRQLADTGQVDFLGSTSPHSLVTMTNNKKELVHQIKDHKAKTEYLFGVKPRVFVNSDLIYSDQIGKDISETGYRAMITNGSKKTLDWRSPNYVYSNSFNPKMNVYCRNEQLSNELAHQLSRIDYDGKVNPKDFLSLINNHHKEEPLVNIYLDYRSLGGAEIEKKQEFIETLVSQIIKSSNIGFVLPSEIGERLGSVAPIMANEPICWVNKFHSDYYPGNELQTEALKQLYLLQNSALRVEDNLNLHKDWQYLQTSDHIHLMDDQHPTYWDTNIADSIFKTKYDAFINYMNILDDFRLKLYKETGKKEKKITRRQEQNKNSQ